MEICQQLHVIDFVVVLVYIIAVLAIGFGVSFKRKEAEDLFLASRSLRWPNIGLSIFGTNISPSFMIAGCGIAYTTGMVTGNFEWLAWIFLLLLAMIFVPHYLNTKISTMPEFMLRRYDVRCRNFLSWYTLINTMILWLGGTLYAGGLLLSQILGWPLWLSVLALTGIATSFTVAGGLAAVVVTDSFQAILMILGSAALTVVGLVKVGGIGNLVESVPGDYWILFRPASDPEWPWPAIILGYPILGIWFWCTDQTVVQRVLGAKTIRQGQLGALLAAFLKISTPLIFYVPGIICKVLYPDLDDPNAAYMTMVANLLPVGMVGLVIAVLFAALISTVDSGLNSLSTVFTLDIYTRLFNPQATPLRQKHIGRIVTVFAAIVSITIALSLDMIKGLDLFSIFQSLIGFMAPPMAAVFIIGVLWKRANSKGAYITLIAGTLLCLAIGSLYLASPHKDQWPHFMLLAFYLFSVLAALMFVVSWLTPAEPQKGLPPLRTSLKTGEDGSLKIVWVLWGVLAVIMICIYSFFQYLGYHRN